MATNHKQLLKEVKKHSDFQFLENGKIHCNITSHDILPTMEEFQKYLNSKSYKKGLDNEINEEDYLPYLVPYKKDEKLMFCKLTKQKLQKKNSILQKHLNGKKMQKLIQGKNFAMQQIQEYEEKQKLKEKNEENEENDIFQEELIDQQLDKFEEQNALQEMQKEAKKQKKQKQKQTVKKTKVTEEEEEEIIEKEVVPVQPIKKKIHKLKKSKPAKK